MDALRAQRARSVAVGRHRHRRARGGLVVVLDAASTTRYERRLATRDPARRRTPADDVQLPQRLTSCIVGDRSAPGASSRSSRQHRADRQGAARVERGARAVRRPGASARRSSNLGSGMLVAFTQPLRLGDRVTIGEQHGLRRGDRPDLHDARHRRRAPRLRPEHPAHDDDDREPHDPRPAPHRHGRPSRSGSARRSMTRRRRSSGRRSRSRASTPRRARCSSATSPATSCVLDRDRLGAARRRRHPARRRTSARPRSSALADAGHLAA